MWRMNAFGIWTLCGAWTVCHVWYMSRMGHYVTQGIVGACYVTFGVVMRDKKIAFPVCVTFGEVIRDKESWFCHSCPMRHIACVTRLYFSCSVSILFGNCCGHLQVHSLWELLWSLAGAFSLSFRMWARRIRWTHFFLMSTRPSSLVGKPLHQVRMELF